MAFRHIITLLFELALPPGDDSGAWSVLGEESKCIHDAICTWCVSGLTEGWSAAMDIWASHCVKVKISPGESIIVWEA